MKKITLKISLLFIAFSFFSCEPEDTQGLEEYNTKMLSVFIYDSDIVGEWNLTAIYADKPVDLNGDGLLNNNLISETLCFESVKIQFNGDKTFTSFNSSISLKGKESICNSVTTRRGIWSLKNNAITFYTEINGSMVKQERQIILTENSFVFEINPTESGSYIQNDKDSSAAISVAALEYSNSGK